MEITINPIIPKLSKRITRQLDVEYQLSDWNNFLSWGNLKPGSKLPESKPIILKID